MKEHCSGDPKMEMQECAAILLEQRMNFQKLRTEAVLTSGHIWATWLEKGL